MALPCSSAPCSEAFSGLWRIISSRCYGDAGRVCAVGIGAVFAGVVRTPMTSVVMIFEMTQDYAATVSLMIANMVSLFVASLLQHGPIYEALAVQDGIHLPSARTRLHLEAAHGRRDHESSCAFAGVRNSCLREAGG